MRGKPKIRDALVDDYSDPDTVSKEDESVDSDFFIALM
jgi:hypothetical protein